jgi:Rieske Fe-S protein
MEETKKIPRKIFLKYLWGALSILFFWLWVMLVKRATRSGTPDRMVLPADVPEGVSFFGRVIIVRRNDKLTVFSSRCTHLGCTIKSLNKEGNLVCPCHGSVFNINGEPENGPATENLQQLPFKLENNKIIID